MYELQESDGVHIVALGPTYEALKPKHLHELYDSLSTAIDGAKAPKMVLDLSQTKFIDSMFLETLFRIWKRLKQRAGDMALCGLDDNCAKVLEVTQLDKIWTIRATREEAVAALKG